ncbi:hypothetical protein FRC05_005813 [Tulasnella sp. 425]|nr:hypothetical protein FRC05_005813 [Tulasnella sp. 425]
MRKAIALQGSSGQSSGTFILRSTLNPDLIRLANKKNDKLYEKEVKSVRALGLIGKKPEDQNYERPSGAILAWKSNPFDVLRKRPFLTNHTAQLKRQFKSFHLYFNSKLPSPAFSSHDEQTLFDHLSDMIKQNYLDRVQVPMPGGAPVQGRARRKSRKRPTKKRKVYTRGGGAHAPMLRSGNRNVAEFICAFMKKSWLEERLKLLGEDKEEEERTTPGLRGKNAARNPNHGAEKEAELEDKAEEYGGGLLKDITRVAGSELTKVLGDPSGTSSRAQHDGSLRVRTKAEKEEKFGDMGGDEDDDV